MPSLLQVVVPALALFLAGATAGYLAFPTYLGPVVLSVSPSPLFPVDLAWLKVRPLYLAVKEKGRDARG